MKARTLDAMVLVVIAIGAGWLYSLASALTGGEVLYRPPGCPPSSYPLGQVSTSTPGGANEAIRALLELTRPWQ